MFFGSQSHSLNGFGGLDSAWIPGCTQGGAGCIWGWTASRHMTGTGFAGSGTSRTSWVSRGPPSFTRFTRQGSKEVEWPGSVQLFIINISLFHRLFVKNIHMTWRYTFHFTTSGSFQSGKPLLRTDFPMKIYRLRRQLLVEQHVRLWKEQTIHRPQIRPHQVPVSGCCCSFPRCFFGKNVRCRLNVSPKFRLGVLMVSSGLNPPVN